MDTQTVLKIIAMLDSRKNELIGWHDASLDLDHYDNRYKHQMQVLCDFKDHLQEYIESQVDQVENEMNRGE
jgi:hypothetical protein